MKEFDTFQFELANDIKQVNRNKIDERQPVSFVTFLGSLTDEKLNMYFEVAAQLVDPESEPTSEDVEMGITFYTSIITELECNSANNSSSIDEKGLWAISLFAFLTMERFYRQGLLANFSGFLYEGQPYFKPTQLMRDMKETVINNMTPAQRKKHNL
jgi:hypothetical protein